MAVLLHLFQVPMQTVQMVVQAGVVLLERLQVELQRGLRGLEFLGKVLQVLPVQAAQAVLLVLAQAAAVQVLRVLPQRLE